METNTIKVLWIEDDLGVYESFRNTAMLPQYGIQFIHADNWSDGKLKLKEQFKEISAIILDAHCKWDKDSPAESRFLHDVTSELWELFGTVRKLIPWYILSAGTMDRYAETIDTANSKRRQGFNEDWGAVEWKKVEIIPQFKDNPLLLQILKVAKDKTHSLTLSRHQDTFKYLGTEGYLCKATRTIMLNALSALYCPEENIGFEFQGNPIRKVIEHMFRHANKMGIIPDDFIDERNNPKLTDCKNFLIGEQPNYVKMQLWDPDKQEPFAIFPKPHYYYLQNVLNYVNSCSHSEEDENLPYIIDSSEKDLFFAITLQLSHLVAFYGKYIEAHKDIEKNKKMHKAIPQGQTTGNNKSNNTSELIEYKVTGPIMIDSQGTAYIDDVQVRDCYKSQAGNVYYTKKVYKNTSKNRYKYYAPTIFPKK